MSDEDTYMQHVTLTSEIQRSSTHVLCGPADLTLRPGQKIILECPMVYKEAGDVRVIRARLSLESSAFDLNYSSPITSSEDWYIHSEKGVYTRHVPAEDPTAITIFPKPPKLEISLPSVVSQYYVGEYVELEVEITNGEEEEINVEANCHIFDSLGQELHCELPPTSAKVKVIEATNEAPLESQDTIQIGWLNPSQRRTFSLLFTAPFDPTSLSIEIISTYNLASDSETLISKTFSGSLEVSNPLEADYQVSTYTHPEPWPNFFSGDKHLEQDSSDTESPPAELGSAIARAWLVTARLTSFASDDLVLDRVELNCTKSHGSALYTITPRIPPSLPRLAPDQHHIHHFELVMRTSDPEERRPVTLDLALDVSWRRGEGNSPSHSAESSESMSYGTQVTTSLLLSPFIVPSPEPRAVCTASLLDDAPQDSPVILLRYTMENPTMHFLTFSVMMEASEEFAFSGIKSTNFNLVPLSRHTVQYHIVPHTTDKDNLQQIILRPDLKITDVYFGQTLKVLPGDGASSDKEGLFISLGDHQNS